jgi:hypothetical protein
VIITFIFNHPLLFDLFVPQVLLGPSWNAGESNGLGQTRVKKKKIKPVLSSWLGHLP